MRKQVAMLALAGMVAIAIGVAMARPRR